MASHSGGKSPSNQAATAWFYAYLGRMASQPKDLPLRCPCCYCRTLEERGVFDICPVCFWEDDGQDDYDEDLIRGGPNGALSLTEARANYRQFAACEERFVEKVRQAGPGEEPAT